MTELTTSSAGSHKITETYRYAFKYRSTEQMPLVDRISYAIGAKTEEDEYDYDGNCNISSITTARGKTQYEYDGLNRLVQEVNNVTGKKYNYTYDAGGNILTKKITDLESGTVQDQLTYYYDSVYKDRLVKVNGQSISGYDLLGRPTNYLGTSLTWENGRVSKFVKNGKTTTCKYNADGIRTEKIYSGIIHKYYLEGNTIVRESVSGNDDYEMLFMYGQNGIVGFTYNNINYYYRKNLLGDIVAIYNESGTKLCEYAYDAWGNCTILFDTNGIGALNPFRYRGYYWDSELNLYYLNARYYDPAICRFISQDSIKYLEPETLNGLNLFAYCLNNPVMETDPEGTSRFTDFCNLISTWFANTFGGATYTTKSGGADIKYDWFIFGYETGTTASYNLKSGDDSKLITFYAVLPEKWWNIFDYKFGIKTRNGEFDFSVALSEISASIKIQDTTYSLTSGFDFKPNTFGSPIPSIVNLKFSWSHPYVDSGNLGSEIYSAFYINPIQTAVAAMGVFALPFIFRVLVPAM